MGECHRPMESCDGPGCSDFKSLAREFETANLTKNLEIADLRAKLEQADMFHMLWKGKAQDFTALIAQVLKDFDDDAPGYCCIRDATLRELRAVNPPSVTP